MNTIFKFRIPEDLKKDFQKKCIDMDLVPSEVLRDYVHSFTYGNVDTSVNTDTGLVDQNTLEVLKPFKVFEIRSGRLVRTYKAETKEFVKKTFLNKELFRLEVINNEY